MLGWTVLVLNTFWRWNWYTLYTRITGVANRTSALRLVVTDKTFSIRGTWILIYTRIDTVLVSTCLVSWTLWIGATSNYFTSNKWITLISWQTSAVSSVTCWVTFGKSSTRILDQTWVNTVSLDAGFTVSAVSI